MIFPKFSFSVAGLEIFYCDAKDKLEAMGKANDHFRSQSLAQGAWDESVVTKNHFRWALGNFFD